MSEYKLLRGGAVRRIADGAVIPNDPGNADYRRYLADVQKGAAVAQPDPEPAQKPSRDARLLAAVASAKSKVADSRAFTVEQAAVLTDVFDGLGKAIEGMA